MLEMESRYDEEHNGQEDDDCLFGDEEAPLVEEMELE